MKPHTASLINAIALVGLGAWGYFSSDNPSMTALIPVIFGVLILAMNKGLKAENKVISHIAVLLTLLILIGLVRPLMGAFDRGSTMAILRVSIMMITCVLAIVYFIKSFRDARKAREAAAK